MSGSKHFRPKAGHLAVAIALIAAPLLSACSGRDTEGAEKIAAAQDAATRAEKAAERAEKAAAKADRGQPTVIEAEPEPDPDPQDRPVAEQNETPNSEPDRG